MVGATENSKVPESNYSVDVHLAGTGPDEKGMTGKIHVVDPFFILEQPLGTGNYVSKNFKDGCYLQVDPKGGLGGAIVNFGG
jgi:hypothetical protein